VLIAQANIEHMTLLTSDSKIAQYPGDIQFITKARTSLVDGDGTGERSTDSGSRALPG